MRQLKCCNYTETWTVWLYYFVIIEPPQDKTNKVSWSSSEDSDQPGHPPSLIRVFAVRVKKAWVLSYPLSAQRRHWSDWADARGGYQFTVYIENRYLRIDFCIESNISVWKKNTSHQYKWSNIVYFNRKSTRKLRNCDSTGLIPTKMHNSLPVSLFWSFELL